MKRITNTTVYNALTKTRNDYLVQVGWFENSKYSNGEPIGKIAAVQNYGATINHPGGTPYFAKDNGQAQFVSLQNSNAGKLPKTKPHTIVIPPSHFMEKTVEANKEDWKELNKNAWAAVFLGKESEDRAMKKFAMAVEGDIAKTITEINEPALKAGTIRARQNKYSNKKLKGALDKRLIATGEMLNALSHKVEKL